MSPASRAAFLVGALCAFSCATACTVQQAVQQRKHAIEHTKGAEVTGGAFERPIEHVGKVRVYASLPYQEQRSGWKTSFDKMVESANQILGPAFAVRLDVVDSAGWRSRCDTEDLQACLAELVEYDSGDDVDWVVGLIAAVPRFSASFDELGMAHIPGRHLILRDLYDPAERAAIDQMFPAMTGSNKTRLYREHLEHKKLVVFLHEWAHTMGALHVKRDDVILYPAYDSEMARFSDANWKLIDASLEDRFPLQPGVPNLTEFLSRTESEAWWPGERERLLAALRASAGVSLSEPPPPSAQMVLSGEDDALLAGVTVEDQARYEEAKATLETGDVDASWQALEPLIERYPNSEAIQHFGCSLAMQVGARQQAGRACRRAIDLAAKQ